MLAYKVVRKFLAREPWYSVYTRPPAGIAYKLGEEIDRDWGPMFFFDQLRRAVGVADLFPRPNMYAVLECDIDVIVDIPLRNGSPIVSCEYESLSPSERRAYWRAISSVANDRELDWSSIDDLYLRAGGREWSVMEGYSGTVAALRCLPLRVVWEGGNYNAVL